MVESEKENKDSLKNSPSTPKESTKNTETNQDETAISKEKTDQKTDTKKTAETPPANDTEETNAPTAKEEQPTKTAQEEIVEDHDTSTEENVEDEFYGIPVRAYDEMNLAALGEELERLLKGHEVKEIRQHVRLIKTEFDKKYGEERQKQKELFLNEGGNIIDFSYSTPAEKKFNKHYFEYKEKRDNYYKKVRKNLQENLERRLSIIEELKAITGVGTDMNANFNAFKKLQERWRKAGPVPRNEYKDTWNTYHHHVERFYDFLHLDREFREMDYQHNLEQKLKMIARAEELTEEKDVNRAFRELQNLHRMWKEEVGPVAQEYSDAVWEKFKDATKKIHDNRKAYFAELDKKREDNLTQKQEIIAKINELHQTPAKSHRQVQQKIKTYKDLREQFFKAGNVPQKDNQAVWDAFKEASHTFNHQKNEFYKHRKEEQKENLDEKLKLIRIAEENKDSEDFETTTPLMKKIQRDWKKIGYVQRNKSDKVWERFQAACNHYFDRVHAQRDEKDKAAIAVFKQKEKLLEETKALSLSGNREEDLPTIKEKIEQWKDLGRVPRNKQHIESKFNKTLDKLFSQLDMDRKEIELLKYENRLQALEDADDEYKIQQEASFLHKKINQTAEEIRQLENNLAFFNNADKDNPLMRDTFKKKAQLNQQLKVWKAKLDKIKRL